ncbi:phosphatase PAP2 family protein [Vibrio sp. ZSDZ65]|uniref:undecaprenyl-diphosphate phosphatase n=1 Tax=Vibrio qingdaonensis TaxID=2829491 RepID=A0A9X3CQQ3_9VIBR|nr:phosphatase PAP2 family protein [Vibrio qingdaonensis]MCW8347695.1 phosphatase PAP2 family protein [Vibrio qingdaonensis]
MRTIEPIARFDLAFSLFCLDHRFNAQVARLSRLISRSGDGPLYACLAAFVWFFDERVGEAFLAVALLAFAIELPIYWVAKNSFKRRRPQELCQFVQPFITPSDRYSLPSGHTAAAFLMATVIGHFYPDWFFVCLVWATLIGVSRVLLGVHFLTDVVIGAVLGALCAMLALNWVFSNYITSKSIVLDYVELLA